jgi:UDP-glucose 4-epimerase
MEPQATFRGTSVLVTGGAGFIGSHLADALVEAGAAVTILDDLSTGTRANLASCSAARLIEASILDESALEGALEGAEAVVHLAAIPSVPRSVHEPLRSHAVNATGTLLLLEACRRRSIRRVVYAATASSLGEAGAGPGGGGRPREPQSPYAVAKLAGESYGRVYHALHGVEFVALRFFNVFGPRQRLRGAYSNVIPAFLDAALHRRPATVYGDGTQTREFTCVSDVVRAILLAIRAPSLGGLTIDVGSGRLVSVLELADAIRAATGMPLALRHAAPRPGDLRSVASDPAPARDRLDFAASVGLEAGLAATAAWFRESSAAGPGVGGGRSVLAAGGGAAP